MNADANIIHSGKLEAVGPETVRLVLQAVERLTDERTFGCIVDELMAGGGLGLLGADAMSQAVKRVSPWAVIDHTQRFLTRLASKRLMNAKAQSYCDQLEELRAGRSGIDAENEAAAECSRDVYLSPLLEEQSNWLEACLAQVMSLAAWTSWTAGWPCHRSEDTLERAADDAGLAIAGVLAEDCGRSAAMEFVLSLRELEAQSKASAGHE